MSARHATRRATGAGLWLGLGALSATVHAEPRALDARLTCPEPAHPGRVVCEVVLRAEGKRLTWADALVTDAPEFARPLRARVGFSQSREQDGQLVLPVALVATAPGTGRLRATARAVICPVEPGRACLPVQTALEVSLRVAPPVQSDGGS